MSEIKLLPITQAIYGLRDLPGAAVIKVAFWNKAGYVLASDTLPGGAEVWARLRTLVERAEAAGRPYSATVEAYAAPEHHEWGEFLDNRSMLVRRDARKGRENAAKGVR